MFNGGFGGYVTQFGTRLASAVNAFSRIPLVPRLQPEHQCRPLPIGPEDPRTPRSTLRDLRNRTMLLLSGDVPSGQWNRSILARGDRGFFGTRLWLRAADTTWNRRAHGQKVGTGLRRRR